MNLARRPVSEPSASRGRAAPRHQLTGPGAPQQGLRSPLPRWQKPVRGLPLSTGAAVAHGDTEDTPSTRTPSTGTPTCLENPRSGGDAARRVAFGCSGRRRQERGVGWGQVRLGDPRAQG